jgi:hypothetical protein
LIRGSGVTVGVGIEVATANVELGGKLRAVRAKNAISTPIIAIWCGLIGKDFMQIFFDSLGIILYSILRLGYANPTTTLFFRICNGTFAGDALARAICPTEIG